MNLEKLVTSDMDGAPLSTLNLLIIEDEPLMRALLAKYVESLMKKHTHITLNYTSYENGWELLETPLDHIHIAVVDILLPKVTGVDLIKNFKKRCPQMGIIPITGMATDPMKRQLLEYIPEGAKILEKPLRFEDFEKAFLESMEYYIRETRSKKAQNQEYSSSADEPSWRAIEPQPLKEVVSVKKRFRRAS
jgi:DNA-binding NtrC family response regulator